MTSPTFAQSTKPGLLATIEQLLGKHKQTLVITTRQGKVYQLATPPNARFEAGYLKGCTLLKAPLEVVRSASTDVAAGRKTVDLYREPGGGPLRLRLSGTAALFRPYYVSVVVKSRVAADTPYALMCRLISAGVLELRVDTSNFLYHLEVTDQTQPEPRLNTIHGLRLLQGADWMRELLRHERRPDGIISLKQVPGNQYRLDVESYWRTWAVQGVGFYA